MSYTIQCYTGFLKGILTLGKVVQEILKYLSASIHICME